MFMLEALTVTLIALIAMQLSPGPNLIAVASTAMNEGRKSALMVVAGIGTGAFCWALSIALGLGAILIAHPFLITTMKIAGGAYLCWLALKAFYSAFTSKKPKADFNKTPVPRSNTSFLKFKLGFLVVMTNPKAALGWTAIASYLFGSGLNALQVAAFAPIAMMSAVMIYGGYGVLFSMESISKQYIKAQKAIEYFFGASFGVLGGKLLFDGLREMKS